MPYGLHGVSHWSSMRISEGQCISFARGAWAVRASGTLSRTSGPASTRSVCSVNGLRQARRRGANSRGGGVFMPLRIGCPFFLVNQKDLNLFVLFFSTIAFRVESNSMAFTTKRDVLEREVEVQFYRAGGPGGQHRNKADTAVRLHHPPSGITVTATERRSQSMNRELAFERLIERLERLNFRPKKRRPTKPTRASKRRRVDAKKRRSAIKKGRGKVGRED